MTTWTSVFDDKFARADTVPGAANSQTGVGNGWTDQLGGVFSLSGGQLKVDLSSTSPAGLLMLTRPSSEAIQDSRVVATVAPRAVGDVNPSIATIGTRFIAGPNGGWYEVDLVAPVGNGQGEGSGILCYLYYNNGYGIDRFTLDNTSSVPYSNAFTYVKTKSYLLELIATGINPTTITANVYDAAAPTVVIATFISTNSTPTVQQPGASIIRTSFPPYQTAEAITRISEFTVYSGSGGGGQQQPTTIDSITPNSVVGDTTGTTCTLTGTNFGATLFTASGGGGATILSSSVDSPTQATVTVRPGTPGYGPITIASSTGGSIQLQVATPNLGPIVIGFVGDSITANTNGSAVQGASDYLTSLGYTPTCVNAGVSGSTSAGWQPGGANLNNALTLFANAGVTIVHIMLGTNDESNANPIPVATYVSNMQNLCNALTNAGYQVVISKPIWRVPIGGSYNTNALYNQIFAAVQTVIDGKKVFVGDTGAFVWSRLNPTIALSSDGLHPANQAANNILGQYWANGILNRYGGGGGGNPYSFS